MTFYERYANEKTWHGRAIIMRLFHTVMNARTSNNWTIAETAKSFGVSVGLVSENIKLANAIDKFPNIKDIPTREKALESSYVKTMGSKRP